MISSGSLQVRPDNIVFRDLEPGESDTVDVWARNIGKKTIFVRFSLPKNPFFVLNAKANISTAPGLEAHATIKYTASTSEKETSELKVTCNDSSVLVPIIAYPPTPAVQLATNTLDFGTVTLNSGQVRSFKFTNYGAIEGKFSIHVSETNAIKITPVFGLIDSNQTQEVQVTFKAETPGDFKCQIFVEVDNNTEQINPINAYAKVVDQSLTLHNPKGEEFGELNFQHLFYGQKKVIPLILRNRGSCTRSFSILPLKSDSSNDDKCLPIFGISPMSGMVKAYSDVTINVTFNPRKNDLSHNSDSEQQYSAAATIQIPETKQDISFNIIGKAVSLNYEITAVDFNFGTAVLKSKQSQKFVISNNSLYLPLNFTIKQVAQFNFSPSSITLKQRESKEITCTFQPSNLGIYNIKTHISFCGGIDRLDLNLSGTAVTNETDESTYQRPGVWDTVKDLDFYKDKPTTRYGLTMKELQDKQQQRKTYDSYITESAEKRAEITMRRNARKEATRKAQTLLNDQNNNFTEDDFAEYVTAHIQQSTGEAEDPISLGLVHCEGMTPPEPPLMKVWEPFKLPESIGLFSTLNPRSRHKHNKNGSEVFDDKVLIEKKFKPKPTTQGEIAECSKKLQQSQQVLISASHQNINFGTVSVFSVEKRSFQITNNLQQSILVSLKCDHEELKESGPQSQVVPPHQTAGFDICVHYDKPESLSKAFEYTINNDLKFSVNVTAEIVPIDIIVEPEVLHFSFTEDNCQPYIKEFVKIRNNSNSTAEFKWSGFDNVFTMHNKTGSIVPHGTFSAEITYKPDCKDHAEALATVTVKGGPTQRLKMIGDTGKPKLQLSKKAISFGLISLNSQQTQELKIKNIGADDAIFTVTPNLTDIFSIIPTGGRIKAKESVDLKVTVSCQKSGEFDVPINVNICGSQPLSFSITGQADVPKIKLTADDLDFGKLYLGNSSVRKVTVANTGMIPAVAFFDLSKYPDFRLDFQPELADVGPNENKNSITLVTDSSAKDLFLQSERAPLTTDETAETVEKPKTDKDKEKETGFVYRMKIIEKSALNFSMVFQPRTVKEYSFDFPLTIMNIDTDISAELAKKVNAQSLQAPLYPSEQAMDFGVTPIYDPNNPNSRAPLKQLLLKNEYNKDIQFRFDDKKCKNFQVDPQSGTIKYASNATVFITFKAKEAQPYSTILPLYATTDKGEVLASEIQLMGVGSSISYKPSIPYVSLPPVPLGVRSHARINLINTSYINTEIKADLPIVEKQFPLSVTFPDGSEMKSSTRELPVEFSFVSNKPMSFSTICAFVDPTGNSTSVTVSCVTDNSIFTLYPILTDNSYRLQAGDGKSIQAKMLNDDIPCDYLGKFLSIENYLLFDKKEMKSIYRTPQMTIDFIVKFLNTLVLSTKIKRFPDDLAASNGELIIEMISNLCGSQKPNNLANVLHTATSSSNGAAANKGKENGRYSNAKSLLTFLSTNGAMLPDVKPEFLLNQTDFCDVMRKKITRQLLGIDYYGAPEMSSYDQKNMNDYLSSQCFTTTMIRHLKAAEVHYKALSTESWLRVVCQVLKLFMFSKLQPERILQIQGVQDALAILKTDPDIDEKTFTEINRPNNSIGSSNFFSAAESMILKWLTIHYCAQNPKVTEIVIDYLRLHDPKFFLMTLKSHILNQDIPYSAGNDKESKEKNIDTIIRILNEFNISCIPTNKEFMEGNEIVMFLFSYQLIEVLPHFLPMTTVEFVTPLSKQVVQSISITNPSKVSITYEARLEGSSNFRALENSIQLGPNETAEFLVEYIARKLDRETAILTLIPGKPKIEEPKTAVLEPPKSDKGSTSTSRRSLNSKAKKAKSEKSEPLVFASTIVINLVSVVSYEGPLKTIEVETNIYETKKMTIHVENSMQIPGKMKMINRLLNEDPRGQIEKLFNNPKEEPDYGESKTMYESMLKKHQTFIFEQSKINFKSEDSVENVDFEFTPISLGTFHCFLLFYNDKYGQFVYEIVGKSNLPQSTPASVNLKTEFGNKVTDTIMLDSYNKNLFNAIGYVNARIASFKQTMTENKFKETVAINIRELNKLFENISSASNFQVEVTSSYFKAPQTFSLTKRSTTSEPSDSKDKQTSYINSNGDLNKEESGTKLPVLFTPDKPGEYLCKVILKSLYDVRVLQIRAIGLAACKTMSVEMQTSSGKQVMQGIPFFNPSDTIWHFKATINDNLNGSFTFPNQFQIQPNSVYDFPISFQSGKIGSYSAELNVVNTDKEAVYKYNVTAEVVDPSAEEKLEFDLKARQKFTFNLDVRPFIHNGTASVTSTIPILNFPSSISFANGQLIDPFIVTCFSVESGKTTGTLTFTDDKTNSYIWYVIDLTVEPPEPEEVIEVKTVARKTVTLKIPVHNPNNTEIDFDVNFSEPDFFGPKTMVLKPYETSIYQLSFCPLTQMKRTSEISFYNKEEGEYIYSIDITVAAPDVCIMAPIQSPIGQAGIGHVLVENPLDVPAHFTTTNDNKLSFEVISPAANRSGEDGGFDLSPHEKVNVDVKFIPSSVGVKESALIGLKSKEVGDWFYRFAGIGKPPQPSSPIIVESMLELSSSGQIVFTNPFRATTKYELSIMTEHQDVFKILNKRHTFILSEYGEQLQIAFSFTPHSTGQFNGTILLTTVGMNPEVRWTYPIIGNTTQSDEQSLTPLIGKSHNTICQRYNFKLIGEKEEFNVNDYGVQIDIPEAYSYLRNSMLIQLVKITDSPNGYDKLMLVSLTLHPKRPLQTTCQITIENPNNHCWRFPIRISIENGGINKQMVVESQLGEEKHERIFIDEQIRTRTEFEAYFVQGSSPEFSVVPDHGFIEPSIGDRAMLPIEVVFNPTTYGKLMHAVLVIDTMESQHLFDLRGKVPDYVPPAPPLIGTINSTISDSLRRSRNALVLDGFNINNTVSAPQTPSRTARKRNFIKDNIESARVTKLSPAIRRIKTPFRH